MGNIFGRWEGSDPSLGAVLTGSHCDAIPLAGMYDGTLGVLGPIEALSALKRAVSEQLSRVQQGAELSTEQQTECRFYTLVMLYEKAALALYRSHNKRRQSYQMHSIHAKYQRFPINTMAG